jgi:type II secretory pathway pseudopilin PulG
MVILAGIVLVSGQSVRKSRMRAAAEQQMALIATAIEQYASFWPRWEVIDPASGQTVVVADKGWPDFVPGRLFAPSPAPGVYGSLPDFNENPAHLLFDVTDIDYDSANQTFNDRTTPAWAGDILDANACLVYGLTSASGKSALVSDKSGSSVTVDIAQVHKQGTPAVYPEIGATSPTTHRRVFVDPWGTPYRYFWVYRDRAADVSTRAYRGFLPVGYGPYLTGSGVGGVGNTLFLDDGVPQQPQRAVSFVLESAGPNKKFGNVWKRSPSTTEVNDAWDNLIITP